MGYRGTNDTIIPYKPGTVSSPVASWGSSHEQPGNMEQFQAESATSGQKGDYTIRYDT